MSPERPFTWQQIMEAEPLLLRLEGTVQRCVPRYMPDFWQSWTRDKAAFEQLVAWNATDHRPRSSAVYDIVYDQLWRLYEDRALETCS